MHRSTLLSVVAVLGTSVGLVVLTTGFGEGGAKRPQGRIVFAAEIDHKVDIFVINADGSHRRNLTRSDAREQGPDWSPNGKSIVYVNASDGPGGALYRMAANGAHPQVLFRETANQIMGAPAWSPDGRRVAFTSARNGKLEVWTYSLGGGFTQITRDGFAVNPSWSPNGKQLAYTGLISPGHATIFVSAADGTNRHDVSHAPFDDSVAVWSPNGQWIALRSLNADWQEHEEDSLVIVNPAGTVRKTLVTGGGIFPADWSPRGDAILFQWNSDPQHPTTSRRQLYIAPVSGGKPRAVRGTLGAISAAWHR